MNGLLKRFAFCGTAKVSLAASFALHGSRLARVAKVNVLDFADYFATILR
jgi:hypothetical protein